MERVDQQAMGLHAPRGADGPALGMLATVPVAALLWLMIIAAAFELFKWATA